ncbi:MAG: sulfotransferase family protein [Actinomycetes bacterium]
MTRPADLVITDLAKPQFNEPAARLRAAMAEMAPAMTIAPDVLLAAASDQTGLSDFGDPWFREPLDVLCTALNDEAELCPAGVVSIWSQLVGMLKNRLLVEAAIRRHPEILDVSIAAPIVILGLPRTGTTHLHNLMSADPALRSLAYWESLEPVLPDAEVGLDPDPRINRTAEGLGMVDTFMPEFKRMHEMTVDHAHEEIQLLAVAGSTMLFETMAPMPTWRDWYKSTDQTPAYSYLRRILQVLSWQRGRDKRWVLKSPQHFEEMPVLRATFPDATFVVTHRDPVAVTASLVMMMAYTLRMVRDEIDVPGVGAYWADRAQDLLGGCLRDRDVLPSDRSVDVLFHDFMADDVATVRRIYGVAGQPFTPDVQAAMDAFMADHPRGKYGRVEHSLAEFGLDAAALRKTFEPYVERFAVRREVPS